jgi:hypothetical protein
MSNHSIRNWLDAVQSLNELFGRRGVAPSAAPAPVKTFGKRQPVGSTTASPQATDASAVNLVLDQIKERYLWQGMSGLAQYAADIAKQNGLSADAIRPHLTADTFRAWDRTANR